VKVVAVVDKSNKSWVDRLGDALIGEPQDREQLVEVLREAQQREIINADALGMIESTLQLSQMQARDILVPRSHMVCASRNHSFPDLAKMAVDSGHSRFPVFDEDDENIVGILLAKDLLPFFVEQKSALFDMRDSLREALFVPESKRLDSLLKEFRRTHNHMVIVIDEYGAVAGLVTIEDVLEQIVGEIEDEHDVEEEQSIREVSKDCYVIKAATPIKEFDDYFNVQFDHNDCETVAGIVLAQLGYMPKMSEVINVSPFQFKVIKGDSRRIHLLECRFLPAPGTRALPE
jgi:magnesium and cobalt transporter